jgi:hypothetical protein
MLAWLRHIISGDLFRSVVIASAAWLIGKAWDLQAQRIDMYGDIAVLLATPPGDGVRLRAELARLQVAAPTPVALAAERVRALPPADPRWPAARRQLVIAMRRDTALWSWLNPVRWNLLGGDDLAS